MPDIRGTHHEPQMTDSMQFLAIKSGIIDSFYNRIACFYRCGAWPKAKWYFYDGTFMKITIPRTIKPPGLIIRAKTYYLELNNKGLYIVALGNAAVMPNTRNYFQQVVADSAVKYFDAKYEVEIAANEQRIRNGELDMLAGEKYSYFLRKEEVQTFSAEYFQDGVTVKIKGGKAKLTLHAPAEYAKSIAEIAVALGKG